VFHVPVHVVVVGCGRVGSELAITLEQDGHSVAVIDKDPRSLRRLPAEWRGRTVVGFGFDRDHLELAGIHDAGAVAAVTSGDNSNILTARIARETYQIANVVARIYDPRRAVIYQRLGIPTVATVTWTTEQVMRRLFPEAAVTEWTDTSGQLVLVERALPDEWAGQRLDQLNLEGRVRLVAVTRASTPRLTTRDVVGQEGDLLHIAARKDSLDELERRLFAGPEGPT
jgi:trk system potassium uptake protein TrkA